MAITAFGGPEGYFILAIIAFGAFEFVVPERLLLLRTCGEEESRCFNLRRLGSSRKFLLNGLRTNFCFGFCPLWEQTLCGALSRLGAQAPKAGH